MAEASTSSSSGHVEEEGENEVKTEKSSLAVRYLRRLESTPMAGLFYQKHLAALLFIRCLNEGQPFKLATDLKEAGKFDDIVIGLFGQLPILMQVKYHSNKRKRVCDHEFTLLNGKFALLKYCETYSSLKSQWGHYLARCGVFEKCIFVFYTNAEVAWRRQPINKEKENNKIKEQDIDIQTADKWQSLLNSGGNFCPILRETHPEFYETFENVLEYKRILTQRKNSEQLLKVVKALVNEHAREVPSKEELDKLAAQLDRIKGVDCYEEFLPRVWIFDGQASLQNLVSLIENDVKKLLSMSGSKSITNALLESVQKCGIMTVPSSMWIPDF